MVIWLLAVVFLTLSAIFNLYLFITRKDKWDLFLSLTMFVSAILSYLGGYK